MQSMQRENQAKMALSATIEEIGNVTDEIKLLCEKFISGDIELQELLEKIDTYIDKERNN